MVSPRMVVKVYQPELDSLDQYSGLETTFSSNLETVNRSIDMATMARIIRNQTVWSKGSRRR